MAPPRLAELGLGVGDIYAIVSTHFDFDHCGRHDAFGAAAKNKSDFTAALQTMQDTTVADLKKQGFEVSE